MNNFQMRIPRRNALQMKAFSVWAKKFMSRSAKRDVPQNAMEPGTLLIQRHIHKLAQSFPFAMTLSNSAMGTAGASNGHEPHCSDIQEKRATSAAKAQDVQHDWPTQDGMRLSSRGGRPLPKLQTVQTLCTTGTTKSPPV